MKTTFVIIALSLCSFYGFCQNLSKVPRDIWEANYDHAIFNSPITFENDTFHVEANFAYADFNSGASFHKAIFNSSVSFSNATFNSSPYFGAAIFRDNVSFKNIRFGDKGFLDLSKVQFNKDDICHIHLIGTDLSKVKIRYGNFRIDTSGVERGELEALYIHLRSRLIELNYIEDAEILDKEYQEWQYLYKDPNNKHWIVNAFQKYWWGYSYDKYLIAYNTVYIFLFFCLVNLFAMPKMCRDIYHVRLISEDLVPRNERILFRVIRRIYQSFFYTGLIFFVIYFKTENFANIKNGKSIFGKKFIGVMYFFLMYGLGLVCLGYLANFVLSK